MGKSCKNCNKELTEYEKPRMWGYCTDCYYELSICMVCGTPKVKNLHPDAGKLSSDVGCIWECIACRCKSVRRLNKERFKLNKELKALKEAWILFLNKTDGMSDHEANACIDGWEQARKEVDGEG